MNIFIPLLAAALASSALTAIITQWFQRRNTYADVSLKGAQETDIYTQAGERALHIMKDALVAAQERITQLEDRVAELESALELALQAAADAIKGNRDGG